MNDHEWLMFGYRVAIKEGRMVDAVMWLSWASERL